MGKDLIDSHLATALRNAWRFLGPNVRNESDFKFELFHQLASLEVEGVALCDQVPDTNSCRLHAETKIENGNNAKADLSICDPSTRMAFNYRVDYALELKTRFTEVEIGREFIKLAAYADAERHYYFLSALPSKHSSCDIQARLEKTGQFCTVIQPTAADFDGSCESHQYVAPITSQERDHLIASTITEVLELYGKLRAQFHGFFWCNYEREQHRGFTYPCEGDFTCQLYHRLRQRFPNAKIFTEEVCSEDARWRIDLVVFLDSVAIPIEIKMNWDQFENKRHKDGLMKEVEASRICERLHRLSKCKTVASAFVILIQGHWRQPSQRREVGLGVFSKTRVPFTLWCFDEGLEKVECVNFSG